MRTRFFGADFQLRSDGHIAISEREPIRLKQALYLPVRTTRPERCDIFAQRYQSQPITTKFQKHC